VASRALPVLAGDEFFRVDDFERATGRRVHGDWVRFVRFENFEAAELLVDD